MLRDSIQKHKIPVAALESRRVQKATIDVFVCKSFPFLVVGVTCYLQRNKHETSSDQTNIYFFYLFILFTFDYFSLHL